MEESALQEQEDVHAQNLRRARASSRSNANPLKTIQGKGAEEWLELIENGHKTVAFILALLLAVISDFADYFIIPALPLIGDSLDLVTGGILTVFFWNIGGFIKLKVRLLVWAATLFELLPFVANDLVPTYILGVVLAWHIVDKEAKRAGEQMESSGLSIEQLQELEKEQ